MAYVNRRQTCMGFTENRCAFGLDVADVASSVWLVTTRVADVVAHTSITAQGLGDGSSNEMKCATVQPVSKLLGAGLVDMDHLANDIAHNPSKRQIVRCHRGARSRSSQTVMHRTVKVETLSRGPVSNSMALDDGLCSSGILNRASTDVESCRPDYTKRNLALVAKKRGFDL
ncbi:hypothetical protein BDP55DRAFT_629820 [Colletotrichum godetiae]|uniref:Uncharacterized protein n=1 Tax=Colletotrichum godetiae TaxID=1209918 RepID=A0AAJ0F066_9PEZI|nr:uncharacterized protein BDP55DRAFT_629820 [Colletotrichum godetiae]KAK1688213.1 hypothetical protein BDP55DRAFT_629820 [Colletotrichum godetiae]